MAGGGAPLRPCRRGLVSFCQMLRRLRYARDTRPEQKNKRKSAPVQALGQGVARISLFRLPRKSRGMARRQGALPGLLRAGVLRTLGVKRHAPRLAARQRGILAFMPLTVVGPGRLIVAGEAARVRPGDEGCVKSFARRCRSRSPPTERLRKAPLEEWIGIGSA